MDLTTIRMNLSKNLRELMRQNPVNGRRITSKELADFLGVTTQTVYYWLAGRTYPNYPQLLAISGYFGVSIDYLFTGKQPENQSLRDALKLSDSAINNIKNCDKDFAPFVDKLLSDKKFFTEYQNALNKCQQNKYLYNMLAKFKEMGGDISLMLTRLRNMDKALAFLNAQDMCEYFNKFFDGIIKSEFPANEAEEKSGENEQNS